MKRLFCITTHKGTLVTSKNRPTYFDNKASAKAVRDVERVADSIDLYIALGPDHWRVGKA